MDTLNYSDTIKTVAIIAEGVPESQTRHIIKVANEKKVGVRESCYEKIKPDPPFTRFDVPEDR